MNLAPVQEHGGHHEPVEPFEQGLAGVSAVQLILHDLVVGPFRAEVGQDPWDPQGPTPQDALKERGHVGDCQRLETRIITIAYIPKKSSLACTHAASLMSVKVVARQDNPSKHASMSAIGDSLQ